MLFPVILAGGSGARLWPLSRTLNPKQFLRLLRDDESLLQSTVKRLVGVDAQPPMLICNEEHRFLAAEQLRQLPVNGFRIVLEPASRNTAPAIALAALIALESSPDAVIVVLPADHSIDDEDEFRRVMAVAIDLAGHGKLVTFGIRPRYAETGYGYIEAGEQVNQNGFLVRSFAEKPDSITAQKYVESGRYFWNSGMFVFPANVLISELGKYEPEMLRFCRKALAKTTVDADFTRIDQESYSGCVDKSIDYAVMERTSEAAMVVLDAGWNDIGSWGALAACCDTDAAGNVIRGDVLIEGSKNSYVHADDRLVAVVGMDDVVVIETKDAVLVAHKNHGQEVKMIVEQLKAAKRREIVNHREVYRPWGLYDSIDLGRRYQVKRITVKPGAKLSVQMHHHRAEHWIVVSGTAKVTNGDKTYLVTENQSTYIPIGQIHSLENPGVIPLELIEVQSGAYLGEDDIVRFEDRYGRVN
ncbi:mannose-1-phosphate guanylyltransferase/mannose-6-phosphate isomerase [Bordetella hinzii 1277]|uniref:mannose-1-phosphate guanylyltransferase/mannose-6-phosphate isomerase n=1 Tax=Bordetella hinzii TaxID=103855 RepID=UPI00045A8546|nr:mannose-1-phosphate guanylyltransferase/mannose-6-phosphate isomerase [Bordetella hinzii]KCB50183.1 mannose-1-phosphate guanylyltransferase/mannose-6-phosphate isomerase [Bordetella hinzii 1277]